MIHAWVGEQWLCRFQRVFLKKFPFRVDAVQIFDNILAEEGVVIRYENPHGQRGRLSIGAADHP